MSIRYKLTAGAMLLLAAIGCSSGRSADMGEAAKSSQEASMASAPVANGATMAMRRQGPGSPGGTGSARNAQTASFVTQRSIVRKADLAVRVENVEKAEKDVNRIASGLGGYVDSAASTDLASEHPAISLTLRVPVSEFDRALDKFEGLGVRLSKSISSEDVTGQLIDLDARLKTMSAAEETYRGLLRQTRDMQSIIGLQDKLSEVRAQMESMAAQRKTLGGLAALSTITLRLEQSAVPVQAPTDPNWLAQTWGESTSKLGAMLRALASVGIWLLVFSPLWAPLAWIARKAYVAGRQGSPSVPPRIV